ncbi:MAG: SgcJ/EcaC family oxidoreductase, partial [Candidatus Sulfotelmatobacter sp.]
GEIYQRLYPEMRTHRPRQEAIRAALRAMKQLSPEMYAEQSAEDAALDVSETAGSNCQVCGHHNREGNRFCSKCGAPVQGASGQPGPLLPQGAEPYPEVSGGPHETEIFPTGSAADGIHHYHHHYHHHYFPEGGQEPAVPRASQESVRETDRLRVAAAAKGEPMSRSEAAVRRLTQEWVLACNTRQLQELAELYASDAMILRSNHPPVRGAAAVREFFVGALEAGLGEVEIDPIRVDIAGDLAHEVGRYSALIPGTVGKRREERGKYLWVFAKQSSGEWKLISDCWSSDLTLLSAESDIPKPAATLAKGVSPHKR